MKSLFIATLAVVASLQVFSQQPIRTCPSDEKNNQLLQSDPVFHRSFQNMERILRQRETAPYANDRIDGVLTIPVVVHVIHLGEAVGTGSNISDAQVQSAITALNQDYRRLIGTNGYGNGVDVEVEFCLASRTPQNQSTNGIVRVNGTSVANYATQGITANGTIGASELAVKQLSNWPRESYMNIWVVSEIENNNGGAGIQGYAYFPFNSVLDGIVVQYRAFGTTGTLNSFSDENRTLTHEVGHYLNLYHTFESTTSCNPSGSCSTQGDRVCDTPPTLQNSSCTAPTCSGAQVANYMDYTPETCQNMFTAGQKLRMRTALETQRGSLLNSLGCVPVNALDVGVSAIQDPVDTVCEGSFSPVVVVYNYGSETVTSLNLNYSLNGGPTSVFAWTGSLLSGTTTNITLPSLNLTTGSQSITVFTNSPNGGSDQNATNNSSSSNFYVASGANAIVTVVLDDWGSETTWSVKTQSPVVVVASGGPYQNQSQGTVISERFCLATNCGVVCPAGGGTGCNYTFNVFDAFGDGQGYQSGSISLTTSSGVTTYTNNWGAIQSTSFCVAASGGSGGSSLPSANFNIQDNTVCPGTQVDFTNTSTNNPTTYNWTFEGGTPATSSASNPQNVVWNTPGTYDVTLTVTNSAGSDTYLCSNCMTVYALPTVSLTGTNPACNGQSNGSISSTVTGTGPFTYLWSNNATTNNVSNLAAGSYSVTVTSSTGCTATGSATLANPASLNVTTSAIQPTCSNTSNGSISTTVTGGTGNKTYLWTPGNVVTSSISNLLPGTYSVTVTDSRGCTATASSILTAPAAISLNYTVTGMLCSTGNTGSINGSASGGSGTYTYLWTPGNATTSSITNLSGGSYSLTVTDGAGCSKTQAYTVSTPSPIVITGTVTNPNCPGGNGSISVSASGGTGNKTFAWNTGANTASIVVGAGSYFVTATDANACDSTQSFTVTAPSSLTLASNLVHPSCNGLSNGSISLSLPGSVGAVTYNWGGGITGAARTGLAAGNYEVTATYGTGCNVTDDIQLIQPSALTATIVSSTSPTCNGGSDGEIQVEASGGTAPYNYNWSGGITGTLNSDLDAGSYTINVSDANNCAASASATLADPLEIQLEENVTPAQCGEANGAIDVSVLNATGTVTYDWSGNVAQGSNPTGLIAGTYTLTVTDDLNCSVTRTFNVQTPANISYSQVIVNASCANVNNGSIDLEVSGGTPPYSFLWSNGNNTASISSIPAGNYNVTVTDSANCVTTLPQFEVTNQYAVNLTLSSSNPLCINSSDGSATATLTGGMGSVNYQWSNGFNGSSNSALSSGVLYSVVATDANGCSASDEITLTAPSAISIVSSLTPPSCGGANNGTVFFSVTGGAGGYTYTWDDGNTIIALGNNNTPPSPITDLAPGNYTLSVLDANGCQVQRDYTLISPSLISLANTIQGVSCNGGSDGSIELTLSGGNGALSVIWSNGQVGLTNDSLSAGQYTVTITDESNCGVEQTFTLLNPEGLTVNLAKSDPLCYGGNDGFVAAVVSGGTGNYSYLWSNASTQNNIGDLTAGFYSLTVGDENGCSAEAIVELTQPNDIQIDIAVVNAQCDGSILGSALATISGGTAPLTYAWSDNASATLNRANLNPGNYTLQVTDANGCSVSQSEAVYALSAATVELVAFEDPGCYGSADGSVEVYINGGDGTEVISWQRNNQLLVGLDSLAYSNLAAGNYRVVATDSQGCSAFAEVTLENPEAIVGNISVSQDISCNGYADGALMASAIGGTGALTFQWENGETTPSIDSLSAGNYSVTVTDSQGCSNVNSLDLSQPELLSYTATFSNPSCVGTNDGSIEIFVTGGTAPYSYDWNGLGSASSLSDLTPDTYGFSVVDINGCLLTSEIVITEPSAIELSIDVSDVTCYGYENGALAALVVGGTAPYEYAWSGPANSDEANPFNIPAGDYDLTVTDANGCSISTTATVTQPDQLNAGAMILDASCLDPLGSAEVTAFGGTEPYEYNWSTTAGVFISSQSTVQDLGSGDYRFLLTDVYNCSVIVDFSISEVLELNVALTAMNLSCFGNIDGSITTTVSNGLPPYQFAWNTGDSTQNLSGLAAGEYTVDVVDDNGCIGSASATLSMPELLTATVDSIADVSCYGGNDGLISVAASGGVSPYLYLWNGEVFGSMRNDLAADTFNITISDDMGCIVTIGEHIVAQPSQISVTVMFEDQSCVANNGSIYLDVVGGVSPFNVNWSNGEIGFDALDLTAGSYSADITDNNGCEASIDQSIGTYCYETQLTSQYCTTPPTSVSLLENIQCDFVQGGTSYEWSFYNNGSLLGTTTTSSTLLTASDIPGVFPGALLGVQVAVEVDGLLYPALSDCYIQIADLPTTQLVAEDCNASISDSAFILNCIAMQDAVQYTWAIQGFSLLDTIATSNPELLISEILNLQANQSYSVTVGYTTTDGFDSPFGSPCNFTMQFDTDTSTTSTSNFLNEMLSYNQFTIYPNPGDGLTLSVKNAPRGALKITDATGRFIYAVDPLAKPNGSDQRYTLPAALPSGVYFVGYNQGRMLPWVVR